MGWLAKWEWIEKYLRIKAKNIASWQKKIKKYGFWLAALCWLPFIGDIIAVTMGIIKTKTIPFLIVMTIGKTTRYLLLGLALKTWLQP